MQTTIKLAALSLAATAAVATAAPITAITTDPVARRQRRTATSPRTLMSSPSPPAASSTTRSSHRRGHATGHVRRQCFALRPERRGPIRLIGSRACSMTLRISRFTAGSGTLHGVVRLRDVDPLARRSAFFLFEIGGNDTFEITPVMRASRRIAAPVSSSRPITTSSCSISTCRSEVAAAIFDQVRRCFLHAERLHLHGQQSDFDGFTHLHDERRPRRLRRRHRRPRADQRPGHRCRWPAPRRPSASGVSSQLLPPKATAAGLSTCRRSGLEGSPHMPCPLLFHDPSAAALRAAGLPRADRTCGSVEPRLQESQKPYAFYL